MCALASHVEATPKTCVLITVDQPHALAVKHIEPARCNDAGTDRNGLASVVSVAHANHTGRLIQIARVEVYAQRGAASPVPPLHP